MSHRYDSRTTTFSPEGRLFQVEYALEAIQNASATIGITSKDGIVLAADKLVSSKLLDRTSEKEKLYQINDSIICAVAGWTADSNVLLNHCRVISQRHLYSKGEEIPVEDLVVQLCDLKQGYTQFGGLRPFGVTFLVAGYDPEQGLQLYHTDPAGCYGSWKATAIGQNSQAALSLLKQKWNEDLDLPAAIQLAADVVARTTDAAEPSADSTEFCILKYDEVAKKVCINFLPDAEITVLMKKALEQKQQSED